MSINRPALRGGGVSVERDDAGDSEVVAGVGFSTGAGTSEDVAGNGLADGATGFNNGTDDTGADCTLLDTSVGAIKELTARSSSSKSISFMIISSLPRRQLQLYR